MWRTCVRVFFCGGRFAHCCCCGSRGHAGCWLLRRQYAAGINFRYARASSRAHVKTCARSRVHTHRKHAYARAHILGKVLRKNCDYAGERETNTHARAGTHLCAFLHSAAGAAVCAICVGDTATDPLVRTTVRQKKMAMAMCECACMPLKTSRVVVVRIIILPLLLHSCTLSAILSTAVSCIVSRRRPVGRSAGHSAERPSIAA